MDFNSHRRDYCTHRKINPPCVDALAALRTNRIRSILFDAPKITAVQIKDQNIRKYSLKKMNIRWFIIMVKVEVGGYN